MLLTQETIETYCAVTVYQIEDGKAVGAVCESEEFGRTAAKDAAQAQDWYETDAWYIPHRKGRAS
jgi:hypothetical protein